MLTPDQIQQYRDDGYVLVRGIFSDDELDRLERAFDGIVQRRLAARAQLDATWGGDWKKDMPQTMILHTHDV